MIFPIWEDLVNLNRRLIQLYGGTWIAPDNVRNNNSLEWVLEAIQYPLFSVDQYPTLSHKAAALAWIIIDDHVFFDGCKRTGMAAMEIFIIRNGFGILASGNEIRDAALTIAMRAEKQYTLELFTEWIGQKIRKATLFH